MKEPGRKDQRGGERSGAGEVRRGEARYARSSGAGKVRSGADEVSMRGEATAPAVLLK